MGFVSSKLPGKLKRRHLITSRLFIIIMLLSAVHLGVAYADGENEGATAEEREKFLEAFDKLGSESYAERKAASEVIVAMGPSVLELLEERRESPDPEIQNAVDRAIREIRNEVARQHIVELIEATGVSDDPDELYKKFISPEEDDRLNALLRLTIRHTKASVPILRVFLEDPSSKVADAAITELKNLINEKNAGIAGQIIEVIDGTPTDEEVIVDRISAFLHFADFRNETLVEKLKNLKNEKAREMIFTRMVLVPEENYIFAFASMLGNENLFIRRYCAGGVEVIVREALHSEKRRYFSFEEEDLKRIAEILAGYLDSDDPVVVYVAAGAVGNTGVDCCGKKLVRLLDSEDVRTARRAALSIGHIKSKEAAGALLEALKKGKYEILPEACDSLARIGDPGTYEPLLSLFLKKDIPFRELVLYAMTQVDLKRSAEELPSLLSDLNVSVRSLAIDRLINAIEIYPDIASTKLPELLKILKEGSQEAKFAAARVIGETGDMTILPDLKELVNGDNSLVRAASFLPIAMISGEGAMQIIKKGVRDPDYQVRVRAAQAWGYLGNWSAFLDVRLVPVDVSGDTVVEALSKMALSTGIHVVFDPGAVRMCSLDTQLVNFNVKGMVFIDALRKMKKTHGIEWDVSHYVLFVTVESRKGILDSFKMPSAPVGCTDKDLLVEKKLPERITENAVAEELEDFLANIGLKTGIQFDIEKSALSNLAEPLLKIDFAASDIPLGEILRLVLSPRGLKAQIKDGRILVTMGR